MKFQAFLVAVVIGASHPLFGAEWEDPSVTEVNRLPSRNCSVPLADESAALSADLEPSTPYAMTLDGKWKISWCGEPSQRPLEFYRTDFDDSGWSDIDVPS